MSEQKCPNCGAMMTPQSDGRTLTCPFCDAKLQVAVGADQLAKGMKLDLADAEAFLDQLATALHTHMGDRTKVRHEGGRVVHFEINLDPDLFIAKHEGGRVVGQYKKLVRGIGLKTVHHPLDMWVQLLVASLASNANENARVAQVLALLKT